MKNEEAMITASIIGEFGEEIILQLNIEEDSYYPYQWVDEETGVLIGVNGFTENEAIEALVRVYAADTWGLQIHNDE